MASAGIDEVMGEGPPGGIRALIEEAAGSPPPSHHTGLSGASSQDKCQAGTLTSDVQPTELQGRRHSGYQASRGTQTGTASQTSGDGEGRSDQPGAWGAGRAPQPTLESSFSPDSKALLTVGPGGLLSMAPQHATLWAFPLPPVSSSAPASSTLL